MRGMFGALIGVSRAMEMPFVLKVKWRENTQALTVKDDLQTQRARSPLDGLVGELALNRVVRVAVCKT
jgi:hypothetical protein